MCSRFLNSRKNFSRNGVTAQCFRLPLRLCVAAGAMLFLFGCTSKKDSTIPVAAAQTIPRPAGVLRVCADPNNLPFSNQRLEGFENKIAELLAQDLGERVEYTWWAQRRGFFRTLSRPVCATS